jgi:hypothetical protein
MLAMKKEVDEKKYQHKELQMKYDLQSEKYIKMECEHRQATKTMD